MLKKIKLNIESYIDNLDEHGLSDGEPEINRASHPATMRISDGEVALTYKENGEGGPVTCSVTAKVGAVTVRRNGAVVSTMVFDEREIYKTVYCVPPYRFDMEIKTKRVRNSLSDSGGALEILYEMDIGGAKKQTRMKITVSEV